MTGNRPVKLFIGSSTEYLDVAKAVKSQLSSQPWMSAELWTDVFPPGTTVIEGLEDVLREFRYAAFLIGDEDRAWIRRKRQSVTRDNVWFEAGLFVGRRGRQSTFLFYPFDRQPKLPSDLQGVVLCPFLRGKRRKTPAKVDQACSTVLNAIERQERNSKLALHEAVEMLEEARDVVVGPESKANQKFGQLLEEALDCLERHGKDCVDALEDHFDAMINAGLDVIEASPKFGKLVADPAKLEDFVNDLFKLLQRTKQLARFDEIFLPGFTPSISRFAYPPTIEAMTEHLRSLSDSPYPPPVREHASDLLAQAQQQWLATLP